MRPTITLNEMRARVGEKLFGDDWIGSSTDAEWQLIAGPFGIKLRRREATEGDQAVEHVSRSPSGTFAAKLERALGRHLRLSAQYATVDSWIEEHRFPVDPRKPADRKTFNLVLQKEFKKSRAISAEPRGPKPKIRLRIEEEMRKDLREKRVTVEELDAMADKELMTRYQGSRNRVRAARSSIILAWKKLTQTTQAKNK